MIFSNKLIIFDCDGVLIDSEIIAARIESELAIGLGFEITPQEICARFAGRPARLVWEAVFGALNMPFDEDFFKEAQGKIHKAFETELVVIPSVEKTFQKLKNKFCVASTTKLENLKRNLKTTGLFDYLDPNIFSASQVERPKPFPDVFLYAAQNMGFAPENCIVIEDSIAGVQAAKAANMQVIGFVGGSHIYDGHAEKLIENGAFDILHHFDDLPQVEP